MSIDFDDKGKIFTDVISKVPVPAIVQTTEHLIRGDIHIRQNDRLKDELDRDELFLAITNAKVMGAGDQVLYESRFLAVRRNQIVWVMPANGSDEGGQL